MAAEDTLTIAALIPCSAVNGPGKRFVLWLQGCRFHCAQCINPQFKDETQGTKITVEEIHDLIKQAQHEYQITGLSLSGGEPLLQADALKGLLIKVKTNLTLSVFLFTGCLQSELSETQAEVWNMCDLVASGRYDHTRPGNDQNWLASANQQLVINGPWITNLEPVPNACEVHIAEDGSVTVTGFIDDLTILDEMGGLDR